MFLHHKANLGARFGNARCVVEIWCSFRDHSTEGDETCNCNFKCSRSVYVEWTLWTFSNGFLMQWNCASSQLFVLSFQFDFECTQSVNHEDCISTSDRHKFDCMTCLTESSEKRNISSGKFSSLFLLSPMMDVHLFRLMRNVPTHKCIRKDVSCLWHYILISDLTTWDEFQKIAFFVYTSLRFHLANASSKTFHRIDLVSFVGNFPPRMDFVWPATIKNRRLKWTVLANRAFVNYCHETPRSPCCLLSSAMKAFAEDITFPHEDV